MKPELEDVLKHYGVKGMKWKQTKEKVEEVVDDAGEKISEAGGNAKDSVEEFLDDAKGVAKKLGKKFSKVDDVLAKFGKKSLKKTKGFIKDKYYDVQEAHYKRQNVKNAAKAMNAAMKNGGNLPKGYKKDTVKVSDRQREQASKFIDAMNKEIARQEAADKKSRSAKRKGLDRP